MGHPLSSKLIELSKKIDKYNSIVTSGPINIPIELSTDVQLPLTFECEALHPGEFKGFIIEEQEIVDAKDTLFKAEGNFFNWDINKNHMSSRKEQSSVDDVVGRVIDANYDYARQALILKGEIYDESIARKIVNKLINFVSMGIKAQYIDYKGDRKYARSLQFEELSLVRAPGDPKAHIYNHSG